MPLSPACLASACGTSFLSSPCRGDRSRDLSHLPSRCNIDHRRPFAPTAPPCDYSLPQMSHPSLAVQYGVRQSGSPLRLVSRRRSGRSQFNSEGLSRGGGNRNALSRSWGSGAAGPLVRRHRPRRQETDADRHGPRLEGAGPQQVAVKACDLGATLRPSACSPVPTASTAADVPDREATRAVRRQGVAV